ncbi:MAG: hypothetical protein ACK55Z_17530, partial [bacterium]
MPGLTSAQPSAHPVYLHAVLRIKLVGRQSSVRLVVRKDRLRPNPWTRRTWACRGAHLERAAGPVVLADIHAHRPGHGP